MVIKSQLSEQDYINVNFTLYYSKTFTKIRIGIIILFFVASLLAALFLSDYFDYSYPLIMLALLIISPLLIYINSKRMYKSNLRLSEPIEYQFEGDYLSTKGESFNAQLSWSKFYKVKKTKNYLILWQSAQSANIIPRRDIWDSELDKLKAILQTHNVKNNL